MAQSRPAKVPANSVFWVELVLQSHDQKRIVPHNGLLAGPGDRACDAAEMSISWRSSMVISPPMSLTVLAI
jgi:hypothetical protein